jgi:hypothetical protein
MRVSIRWRLMILLLGFGVLPLVLVTSMNRAGFRGVAKDVGTGFVVAPGRTTYRTIGAIAGARNRVSIGPTGG